MIGAAGIELLRPHWLLALPALALLFFVVAPRVTALAAWDRAVDPVLMAALQRLGRVVPGANRRNWFPLATAAAIALALVGPAREVRDAHVFRNLDGLILVVDLSRSVAEGGDLPAALTASRLVLQAAGTRPAALVVYGGDAYLASAFTQDHRALGMMIAVLDGKTVPNPGSRPERGLAAARRSLSDADVVAGDVVLVSDGGGIGDAAFREAADIAARGGRVSSLIVAARAGPPSDGAQRTALEALARSGGGAVADVLDPGAIADLVGQKWTARHASGDFAALAWQDFGRFVLVLALFPALCLFRRGA